MSICCYSCKEPPLTSYKFKKQPKNISSILSINITDDSSTYCHRMCPECLIRYIFIKNITLFSKPSKIYTFTCPCQEGKLILSYEQLIDVFQNKTFDNLKKKKDKICRTHNKKYSKYCKDCNVDICEDCISESYDEHFNHRIEDKQLLLEKLKKFFEILNLRYYDFNVFNQNFDNICQKFKEILEKNYNETLIYIDKIINDLIDFRAKYSSYYKEKVISNVQTLKLLKLFYCNYYYDIKKAENGNDFKIYQYLNQINFELDDVKLNDDKEHLIKLQKIKENSDYLNNNLNKILNIEYSFKHVLNGFRKYQSIQRCDDKLIKSILKLDEHKIITIGDCNYMQYLEEKNGDFSKISKIPTLNKITSVLLFKNGNILTSFGKNNHSYIQEWIQNEKYSNYKISKEDLIYNKILNDSDINTDSSNLGRGTTLDPGRSRQNSTHGNNPHLYESSKSFLSKHKDYINCMIEMDNAMFASGGNDKCIIIWKKDEEEKSYKIYQKISKDIKSGIKNMIFLYDKRLVSNDTYSICIWYIEKNKLNNPYDYFSLQQKLNNINGEITTIYQIREGSIISGYKNSNVEIWNEIEGKYKSVQKISLKISGVTCINQLKDDRIIIASEQGYIKILEFLNNEYKINENINTIKGMPIQCVECLGDGSFLVGQNTTLHVWKNNESI